MWMLLSGNITRFKEDEMNKPNNYDNVSVGNYEPVALGGHKMVIKKVVETTSRAGSEMLIVYLDFAQDDVQPGKFSKEFSKHVN